MLSNLLWNFSISVKEKQVLAETNGIKLKVGKALTSTSVAGLKPYDTNPAKGGQLQTGRKYLQMSFLTWERGSNQLRDLLSNDKSLLSPLQPWCQLYNRQKTPKREAISAHSTVNDNLFGVQPSC